MAKDTTTGAGIGHVADPVGEIARATAEQASGLDEVNAAAAAPAPETGQRLE